MSKLKLSQIICNRNEYFYLMYKKKLFNFNMSYYLYCRDYIILGIRSSVNAGNVTVGQLNTLLPFISNIELISLSGQELLDALEHSVKKYIILNYVIDYVFTLLLIHRYDLIVGRGEFLQMSGMHVVFDLSKAPGSRVVKVRVKCASCKDPRYNDLNLTKNYNVLVTEFVNSGGDGYTMLNVSNYCSYYKKFNAVILFYLETSFKVKRFY